MKLHNFPLLSQLDDQQEINRLYDCVPACIAAALRYLVGGAYTGASVKDAVYGKDYQGPTAPANYVAFCHAQGVTLSAIDGDPKQLLHAVRAQLAQARPVMGTIPDPYANPSLDWTHVVTFFGMDESQPHTLLALDPYGGKVVTKNDTSWASLLQFRQVWTFYTGKRGDTVGVPIGWTDDGTQLKPPNSEFVVVKGFRQWILAHEWDASNIPLENEQSLPQIELSNPSLGAGTRQRFRWTTLEHTEKRGVFESWTGPELLFLERELKQLLQHPQAIPNIKTQLSANTISLLQDLALIIQALLH
ncbi:MAG: hypothetical protein E6J34_14955 [Chloroflexi bacterium]|nr:MAG: hypothetical protein E6J34_14955 [Chloroflexota bacterium]